MSDPASRMLRLLSLLQTHRFWPGEELAGRLDVSARTLRRDIDRLRELGYPVHASRGTAGGYRLQAGTALPPLLLDGDEAVAIAVGLRTAASGSVAGIGETSVRALAKLEQVLPAELRRRVHALQAYTVPGSFGGAPTVDPDALTVIAQACRDDERLAFEYHPRRGEPATRAVEPHRLVSLGRRWYLVAWDTHREAWRTFRVDRLTDPRTSGARFAPRELPAEDAAAFVQEQLRSFETRHHAVATVEAPAEHVSRHLGWWGAEADPLGPDRCRLRMSGESLGWLAAALAILDRPFAVHEPPELAAHLDRLAGRIAAQAPQVGQGEVPARR